IFQAEDGIRDYKVTGVQTCALPIFGSNAGDGLAFLVEEVHSPTRERLRAALEKAFPKMMWCVYDAALSEAQNYATRTSFGENVRSEERRVGKESRRLWGRRAYSRRQ